MTWIVEADHGPEDGCEIVGVFEAERDAIKCMVGEERAKTKRWYGPEYSVNEWHGRRQIPCVWWYVETNMNNEIVLKLCEYGECTEWTIERKQHRALFIGDAIELQNGQDTPVQANEWLAVGPGGTVYSVGSALEAPPKGEMVIGLSVSDAVGGEVYGCLLGSLDRIKLEVEKAIICTADEDANAGGTVKVNLNV
jgi:hypothetical protein